MATYTTNGGIKKIATGDESGTWGASTNTNFDIIDRLSVGVGDVSLSGTTHTLTTADGSASEGQYHVLVLGGSPSGTNTITVSPSDVKRFYVVKNNSGETATFTQGSGSSVSVADGNTAFIYCDGAGAGAAVVDLTTTIPVAGALLAANNLSDVADAGTSRTNLGLAVGSDVLAYDANLQAFVDALTLPTSDGTSGQALVTNGSGTVSFGDAGIGFGKAIAAAFIFG